jgi:hypothetical protein
MLKAITSDKKEFTFISVYFWAKVHLTCMGFVRRLVRSPKQDQRYEDRLNGFSICH